MSDSNNNFFESNGFKLSCLASGVVLSLLFATGGESEDERVIAEVAENKYCWLAMSKLGDSSSADKYYRLWVNSRDRAESIGIDDNRLNYYQNTVNDTYEIGMCF